MTIKTSQPLISNQEQLLTTIARFWDKTSLGWRAIWGPHIHHGYYDGIETISPLIAQERLIDKLSSLVGISPHDQILDVGCGMGGSTLYLAKHYHAHVEGITLSKKQIAIAYQSAIAENINHVVFKIEDAHQLKSYDDEHFDIVWSLESCEQFHDKLQFLKQAFRVLKPGGKLMLATWCSDKEEYHGFLAKQYRKLCMAFDLPYMPTLEHYTTLLKSVGFDLTLCEDWSLQVAKSWDIGLQMSQTFSFIKLFKLGGIRGLRFLRQAYLMRDAFQQKRVRYGVFIAVKP